MKVSYTRLINNSPKVTIDVLREFRDTVYPSWHIGNFEVDYKQKMNNYVTVNRYIMNYVCCMFRYITGNMRLRDDSWLYRQREEIPNICRWIRSNDRSAQLLPMPSSTSREDIEGWLLANESIVSSYLKEITKLGFIKLEGSKELLPGDQVYSGESLYYISELDSNWGKTVENRENKVVINQVKRVCPGFTLAALSLFIIEDAEKEALVKLVGEKYDSMEEFINKYPNCKISI